MVPIKCHRCAQIVLGPGKHSRPFESNPPLLPIILIVLIGTIERENPMVGIGRGATISILGDFGVNPQDP